MIRNPERGFHLPDQLPHDEVMEVARPYLGPFISKPVDWTPRGYRDTVASFESGRPEADQDIWQFKNFLVA